jgi:hypothetical protein
MLSNSLAIVSQTIVVLTIDAEILREREGWHDQRQGESLSCTCVEAGDSTRGVFDNMWELTMLLRHSVSVSLHLPSEHHSS